MRKAESLVGQQFGRLTVIRRVDDYVSPGGKKRDTQWLCRCSCTERKEVCVTRERLVRGTTKSCGCIRRELTAEKNRSRKKVNRYDISGEFGIGYTSKDELFWFDLEDYEKVKGYCWYFDHHGYLVTNIRNEDGKRETLRFHRLILPAPPTGMVVDHRIHPLKSFGQKSDNRKQNLRYVTASQNAQNQVPLRSSNTSGQKGVSWNKNGCWKADISAGGRRHTKYFQKDEFGEACKWYVEMAKKLHGEYRFEEADIDDRPEEQGHGDC